MEKTTLDQIRQHLNFNLSAGTLAWRQRKPSDFNGDKPERQCAVWNSAWAGKPALNNLTSHGYRAGTFLYEKLYAHRVLWALNNRDLYT